MRVAVIHPSFSVYGGAEEYAVQVIRALSDLGHHVEVYLLSSKGLDRVKELADVCVRFFVLKPRLASIKRVRTIYDFVIDTYVLCRCLEDLSLRYDLIVNTKANEVPIRADVCVVHYPLGFALYHWDRVFLGTGVDPKYASSLFWKLYIQPFRILFYRLSQGIKKCKVVVSNSSWTAELLRDLAGIESIVVYPPLDVCSADSKDIREYSKKLNLVVTISRFDPSKRLEAVLFVAKHVPKAHFLIIGRVDDEEALSYFRKLIKLRNILSLNNVMFIPNASNKIKQSLLSKAKVYFHPAIGEHFGISVVEALARGCVPVVHRFSGSCKDIVVNSKYGFCYDTYSEAAIIIKKIIDKDITIEGVENHLEKFTYKVFTEKIQQVVRYALRKKETRV